MPRLTLTLQDGATTKLPLEHDLDDAEAGAFLEGWADGWEAGEDGLKKVDMGRTYDTEREAEVYYGAADLALSAARWLS